MPRRKPSVPRRRPIPSRKSARVASIPSLPELLNAFRDAPQDVLRGLAVGEALLRNKLETKIVETLAHLDHQYPFRDPRHAEFFNRLMALGYAHTGDLPGTERMIARARRDFGSSLDIQFVDAFVKLSMREYREAAQAAIEYERLYDVVSPKEQAGLDLCRTASHASQVANFRGAAQAQLGDAEGAVAAYRRSIAADPGNHLPYLNLVGLLRTQGKLDEAADVLEQGLRSARQVSELRMLQSTVERSARISACMIVKNEEELLPGCLDSIRDWVDEIVVVDTGSSDRTVDIARQYGARIFVQPWTGDFSRHRNYSIEQATGDWIFIVDADERMFAEDVPLVLRSVNQNEHDILSVSLYNVYGRTTRRVTFANSVRFFRRELGLRYEGIVHNDLVLPPDRPILRTRIRLEHLGYDLDPERMRQKFERTRALLQKQLDRDPDNTFALFNYAELLRGVDPQIKPENALEIVRAAGRVVELASPSDASKRHLHLMCLNQLAGAQLALGNFDAALSACDRALETKPNYLDAIISRAMVLHRLGRYDNAIAEFDRYLRVQATFDASAETDPIILSHPESRDLAHNNLGILYQLTGRPEEARRHYLETLEINPSYRETASLLGLLCLQEGRTSEAEVWFRHQLEHSLPTLEALMGLARICSADGRDEEAEVFITRALSLRPDDSSLRLQLCRLLLNSGRADECTTVFESMLAENDTPDLARRLGDLCYDAGELERAVSYYDRAVQSGQISVELLNNFGNCHYKLGDFEEAIKWYHRAIELSPDDPLAHRNLGLAQVRLGRASDAVKSLRRCLERNPEAAEIAHLLADQHRALGDYEAAVRLYEQALRQRPSDFTALFGLAETYLIMGHSDSALTGYRRVLQLKPDFRPALERVSELTGQAVGG